MTPFTYTHNFQTPCSYMCNVGVVWQKPSRVLTNHSNINMLCWQDHPLLLFIELGFDYKHFLSELSCSSRFSLYHSVEDEMHFAIGIGPLSHTQFPTWFPSSCILSVGHFRNAFEEEQDTWQWRHSSMKVTVKNMIQRQTHSGLTIHYLNLVHL